MVSSSIRQDLLLTLYHWVYTIMAMITLKEPVKFDWDGHNQDKSLIKHQVTMNEAEEAFFDLSKQEYPDPGHSENELRKIVVGKTKRGRLPFIVYTIRKEKVRIISARDLNKTKERNLYEEAT